MRDIHITSHPQETLIFFPFSLLLRSNPVNSFLFFFFPCSTENQTHHLPVKSQQSAFAQCPEGEKWQRDDMTKLRAGDSRRGWEHPQEQPRPPRSPTKSQKSPGVTATTKRPKARSNTPHPPDSPLPSLVGLLQGGVKDPWGGGAI